MIDGVPWTLWIQGIWIIKEASKEMYDFTHVPVAITYPEKWGQTDNTINWDTWPSPFDPFHSSSLAYIYLECAELENSLYNG